MTGEQLLRLVERGRLAPPVVIDSLRRQIAASERPVLAAAVAKVLVDAGHLTAFQARQLIGGPSVQAQPAAELPTELELAPAHLDDEELELAPLDETAERPQAWSRSTGPASLAPLPPAELQLGEIDDPIGQLLKDPANPRIPPPESSQILLQTKWRQGAQPLLSPAWWLLLIALGGVVLLLVAALSFR